MSLFYAWEKCHNAVASAAVSTRSLQERLADAYCYHIMLLSSGDMPGEIWQKIQSLAEVLERADAEGGGVHASARMLSDGDARDWLKRIVGIYNDVAKAYSVDVYKQENARKKK